MNVVGYGATSKSTTILNYSNIGPDLISYICDNKIYLNSSDTIDEYTNLSLVDEESWINSEPKKIRNYIEKRYMLNQIKYKIKVYDMFLSRVNKIYDSFVKTTLKYHPLNYLTIFE